MSSPCNAAAKAQAAPQTAPASGAVRLGPRDDAHEREADRVADQVMAGVRPQTPPPTDGAGDGPPDVLRRAASSAGSGTGNTGGTGRAADAVARGGRAMAPTERAFFEPRFGRDLGHVRLHTDEPAARGIGARAYTLRNHIAFAPGQFDATSTEGRRLIAHELTHTMQGGGTIRRQVQTLPDAPSFDERLQAFTSAQQSDPAHAAELVRQMAVTGDSEEIMENGVRLLFWALDNGFRDAGQAVIDRLSGVYNVSWAIGDLTVRGPFGPTSSADPAVLAERGMTEARAGRHDTAFELFTLSYELAQLLLIDLTNMRREEIGTMEEQISGSTDEQVIMAQAAVTGIVSPTVLQYPAMSRVIEVIRTIFSFYPRGQIAAERAGDRNTARHYAGMSLMLRTDLIENHSMDGSVIVMESVAALNEFGTRGYRTTGVGGDDEVVTPLPGTPTTEELGLFPTFNSDLESLTEAVAGQEEFLAEVANVPEVRRAFSDRMPDMGSQADRLRLWAAMYRSYQRTDTLGMGVLNSLISLIGRYLRSFTRHTDYNIRDFGVSYLSSEMPVDLTDRAARDCGVYALTVAYEVYRTARAAQPRLSVDFQLFSVPEHVTLVIIDNDRQEHYVVNNDRITPPRRGGQGDPAVLQNVANALAQTFATQYVVRPMQDISLGSTRDGEVRFRRTAWENYRITTLWGLETEAPTGPDDTRSDHERAQATYERYYEAFRNFDRGARNLQTGMDGLVRTMAGQSGSEQRSALNAAMPDFFPLAARLMGIFLTYGPRAQTVVSSDPEHVRAVMGPGFTPERVRDEVGDRAYFFAHQPGRNTGAHPLSRMALALLRLQDLGVAMNADQVLFLDFIRAIPGLNQYVDDWINAGRPGQF